jgi:L-lactate utilization protein LutB
VCPVRIPIPDLIRRLRNESYDQDGSAVVAGGGYKKNLAETLGMERLGTGQPLTAAQWHRYPPGWQGWQTNAQRWPA